MQEPLAAAQGARAAHVAWPKANASLPTSVAPRDFRIDTQSTDFSFVPMQEEELPKRKTRGAFHCPPDWVSAYATFFLTVNCNQRGPNQLANQSCANGIASALEFYHQSGRWNVELAVIMPDHIHLLLSFRWDPGNGMMPLMRNWKRYTASHLGIEWQRDYFDHRIRSESDHQSTWFYMRENPVRARLVESYEQWPFVWRPEQGMGW